VPHLPPTPIPSSSPLAAHLLRLGLAGANAQPVVTTAEELPGTVNYFIGNDPARWRSNVPTYAKVVYHDVYPGIDVAYYGRQGQLEDDFIVHPGADPQVIALRFAGSALPVVNAQGDLALHVGQQDVFLRQPLTYQDGPTGRRVVGGRYAVAADGQVTFRLGAYDAARLLVIDPVLAYATYLGGSNNDAGTSVAVDSAGNAYITGTTNSNNFPTTNGAFQTSFAGGSSDHDVFVSKLNPSGSGPIVQHLPWGQRRRSRQRHRRGHFRQHLYHRRHQLLELPHHQRRPPDELQWRLLSGLREQTQPVRHRPDLQQLPR